MNSFYKYLVGSQTVAIIVLSIILYAKGCQEPQKPVVVDIPSKRGQFKPSEPVYDIPDDTTYQIEYHDSIIFTENPVNKELLNKYETAKDSLDRLQLYVQAIEIRSFEKRFEDSLVHINVFGKVQGFVKSIVANYTIKPRQVKVVPPKIKETYLRVFLGGQFGASSALDRADYSFNLSVQGQNKSIYGLGWAYQQNAHMITFRYDYPILELKK